MKTVKENPNIAAPHWSEARLIERLYGLEPPLELSAAHLEICAECGGRWKALQARRAEMLSGPAPAVSEDRLRAQRIAVFQRVERPAARRIWALAPAAATALLVVMGVALQAPAPVRETQTASVITQSDRELFSEIAALMEQDEPRAADPFRGLFDSNSSQEVQ